MLCPVIAALYVAGLVLLVRVRRWWVRLAGISVVFWVSVVCAARVGMTVAHAQMYNEYSRVVQEIVSDLATDMANGREEVVANKLGIIKSLLPGAMSTDQGLRELLVRVRGEREVETGLQATKPSAP